MSVVRVKTIVLLTLLLCVFGISLTPCTRARWEWDKGFSSPFEGGERLADFRTKFQQTDPRPDLEENTDSVGESLFYAPFIVIIASVAALMLSTKRKRKNQLPLWKHT